MNSLNKITASQLVSLWIIMVITVEIETGMTSAVELAKEDTWVSVLFGFFIGVISIVTYITISSKFPQKKFACYSKELFGSRIVGVIVSTIYIIAFLVYCALLLDEYGHAMTSVFVPETPQYVYEMLIIIPVIYAAVLGIAVPARLSEILLPLGLFIFCAVIILNLNNMDFSNYLPILENGIKPVIQGSLSIGARMTPFIILLFICPEVENNNLNLYTLIGALVILFFLLGLTLTVALLGAEYTSIMNFLFLELFRNIAISDSLSRLDPFIMITWIIGVFIFVTTFIYGASILTRDLLGLKNQNLIVFIYSIIVFLLSAFKENFIIFRTLVGLPLSYAIITINIILPIIMVVLIYLRGYHKNLE